MHALIVDDDPVFSAQAAGRMADAVSAVTEMTDGLAAWELAQSKAFDVALIDLELPGLDGFALISRLRSSPRTRQLPVIVITARNDREAIDAAFSAGATFFLTKPINWALFSYQLTCVMRLATSEREARQAHQRAQAESRIKDTVIGRLNCNLRPLTHELSISATELAALASNRAHEDIVASHAATLVADARRLEEDLSNMIVFTKAVSAHLDLWERPASVHAIFEELLQLADGARDRGVVVSAELPSRDIEITCDRDQLTRALLNLLENALRFAPPGSVVRLAARQPGDGSVYFSIDDEGPGIAPDLLAQLLSPLVDADAGSDVPRLSGLGLAVAKLIAEGHGGTLTVRSAPGRGTTASIHLPPERVLNLKSFAA